MAHDNVLSDNDFEVNVYVLEKLSMMDLFLGLREI